MTVMAMQIAFYNACLIVKQLEANWLRNLVKVLNS